MSTSKLSDKQSDNCSGAPPARRYGETSLHKLGNARQGFREAKAPESHQELTDVQHRLQMGYCCKPEGPTHSLGTIRVVLWSYHLGAKRPGRRAKATQAA